MNLLTDIGWKDVFETKSFADIAAQMHHFGRPATPHQVIGAPLPTDKCFNKGVISKEKLTELGYSSVQDPSLKKVLTEQAEKAIRSEMSGPFEKDYIYLTGVLLVFTNKIELYRFYRDYEDLQDSNSNGNDAISSISSSPAFTNHSRQVETKPNEEQEIKKEDSDTHSRDEENCQQTVRRNANIQIQAEEDKDEDDKNQEEWRLWYKNQLRIRQQKNSDREP